MANHEMNMTFKAKSDMANKGIQETIQNMKALGREIISVQTKLKPNGNTSYVVQYKNALDRVTETYKRLEDGTVALAKSTSTSLKKGFDAGRLLWYFNILRGVLNRFKSIEQSAIDFNETIEKFNVSFGNSVTQATKFQNIISETFGTSRADMMNYQSNFRNVMAGLGDISSKTAEKISESLTKMSLDYSSLFNVSQDAAANKIQAALVGQIMPVRRESGYDVSKNAVNQRASELGIERTYAQLTETEKRLIRIMLLMDQMKNTGAFEDLARTVESPSNQIKILKNQLQELGIWLGNVFMGTIGAILPYINGFVMALKELIKMFAIFVGYKPIAAGEGEALQVAEQAAGGVSDNLGSAAGKAKELKKQLQGFDELNIINTPKDTSGGGGGGGGAPIGIDPAILGALSEYDSLMDGVRMKATEIRDKIMEWLGFIKNINPLTGEISWELQDGYTNFEKILDVVGQIGRGILAWKVSDKVLSFIQKLGFLENVNTGRLALGLGLTVTGIFAEYNGIKHILNGDVDMFTLLETLLGGATTTFGVVSMLRATKWGKSLKGKQWTIGIGVTLAIASISVLLDGIEKGDIMQQILSGLGLAASGAMIGHSVGEVPRSSNRIYYWINSNSCN